MGGCRSRENTSTVDSSPTIFLSFVLAGTDIAGSPDRVAYHSTHTYFQGNLALIEVHFDFSEGTAAVSRMVSKLVSILESNEFKGCDSRPSLFWPRLTSSITRFNRLMVSVTSHSDPTRGDLHTEPEDGGSASVTEVSLASASF
jgi:hypothetical protein